jgi:hypothetical protein
MLANPSLTPLPMSPPLTKPCAPLGLLKFALPGPGGSTTKPVLIPVGELLSNANADPLNLKPHVLLAANAADVHRNDATTAAKAH